MTHLPDSQFSPLGCLVVVVAAIVICGSCVLAVALVVRLFLTVAGII